MCAVFQFFKMKGVLEIDCQTVEMYLRLLKRTLKNVRMVTFMFCVLPQLKNTSTETEKISTITKER